MTRAVTSAELIRRWVRSGSATTSWTRERGSSEPTGSWNTTCISRRRTRRSPPVARVTSLPVDLDATRRRVQETQQAAREGRLARTRTRRRARTPRPPAMARSTPSTARMMTVPRPGTWTGNSFTSPSMRTRGAAPGVMWRHRSQHAPRRLGSGMPPRGPGRVPAAPAPRRAHRSTAMGHRGAKAQPVMDADVRGHAARDRPQRPGHGRGPGHGRQQAPRVGVLRRREQRLGRGGLHDPARIQHRHPVADVPDDAQVVGDEHDAEALLPLEAAQQRQDLGGDGHVQRGRRLVRDEQPRPAQQGGRDHRPLEHAARELMRDRRASPGRRRACPPTRARPGSARGPASPRSPVVGRKHVRHLGTDGEHGVERRGRVLEDHGDLGAPDRAQRVVIEAHQVLAVEAQRHRRTGAPTPAAAASPRGRSRSCRSRSRPPPRPLRPAR